MFSPRLLLRWDDEAPATRHRAIEGSCVFADVSGFTRLSERLARTRGKAGAEELTVVISALFGDLLTVAAARGGEMLKYGGDAVLVFFRGDAHAARAAAAAWEMQRRLKEVGRVPTDAGPVRLRMSVGIGSGVFDLFRVGRSHDELVVAGPATTLTAATEAAADAGEILLSPATAAALAPAALGAPKAGGRLLRRLPDAPSVPIVASTPAADAERFIWPALRPHLGPATDPEHRLVTVAFVHLMGLDDLLVDAGPQTATEHLHETLATLEEAFADLGVTFLATDLAGNGTKVMAACGAPVAEEESERRMLLALRRLLDADTPLPVRAGVNRGHVFAASVGPPFRQTYTTIGDVTNTAARLMGHARPGELLTLRSVLDAAGRGVVAVQAPSFAAKGKAEPLVPHRVLAVNGETRDSDRSLPFVGRQLELDCLRNALADVAEGRGAAVEVVGDMGAGKSRIVAEVLGEAEGCRVEVVHCEPYERVTALHPIRRLLESVVGRDVAGAVRRHAPHLEPWLPLIAAVVDVVVPDTPATAALEPRFRAARTAAATVELLRAVLDTPTVVVVEDVHWLDDASAVVLAEIEHATATAPWLLVVTRRNEPSPFTAAGAALVQLLPLDDASMRSLVEAATATAPLPPHDRISLVDRAGGNPLYLTELLDAVTTGTDLPDTLEDLIAAQIDRLPPEERRLLRVAAVLGSRFTPALLGAVTEDGALAGLGPDQLSRRLHGLVVPEGGDVVRFRHQLVRDVAYGSLPFSTRRRLHGVAAAAIEVDGGEERAAVLSMHLLHAQRYADCWRSARVAGHHAAARAANVEAVELFERAIAAARNVPEIPAAELAEVWEELGNRRSHLGEQLRARRAYREARRRSRERAVDLARLCRKEARTLEGEGDLNGVARWLRRGLHAIAGATDTDARAERAEIGVHLAQTKMRLSRNADARRWAQRALDDAVAAGNRWAEACALVVLDGLDIAAGRPRGGDRAARVLTVCDEITGPTGDQAAMLNNLGAYAYYEGRWVDAVQLYERGRVALESAGNLVEAGYGTCNVAEILVDQGHVDAAERTLDELTSMWTSVRHTFGLAFVNVLRARILVLRGEPGDALVLLRDARESFERNGLVASALDADARIADCLLRTGDLVAARQVLDDAKARDRAAGGTRTAPMLLRTEAWLRAARGDLDAALEAMGESLAAARAIDAVFDVALALEGLADLAAPGAPEPDGAASLLRDLGVVVVPPSPVRPDAPRRAQPMAVPAS